MMVITSLVLMGVKMMKVARMHRTIHLAGVVPDRERMTAYESRRGHCRSRL